MLIIKLYLIVSMIESVRCIYDAYRYGIFKIWPAWVVFVGALFDGLVWLPEIIWRVCRGRNKWLRRQIENQKTES